MPRRKDAKNEGFCINDKGYKRITSGPWRGWYEHRKVILEALVEQRRNSLAAYLATLPRDVADSMHGWIEQQLELVEIPANVTIHHIDHDKLHNCRGNLLMLEMCLHDKTSQEWKRRK